MQQSNKIEATGLICLGLRSQCSDNRDRRGTIRMLVWEEDRTTENVHAASAAPHAVSASPSPVAVPSPAPNAAPAAAPIARRVRAADKRIINGATDVNQLVPFKSK